MLRKPSVWMPAGVSAGAGVSTRGESLEDAVMHAAKSSVAHDEYVISGARRGRHR